ncbi:heme ABC transporter ATP-binding protein [Gordonia sp. HNM0687]|uniref:Heme ABC transporter ATP-binding protein n=1 Tax=Gordonia mangrovi TaxID=2665643 RepID=A0A6L7GR88_9ACTN|nr:heme ABC transporter ATP-binding protein [Gordonia mangrovi]MXP22464.1 heme ABC transporter ATP-binding protein [Gordonia mangrovi]UVF77660.1 heme ABC transporter ATP-binding protein [Gordonia mangrovi]
MTGSAGVVAEHITVTLGERDVVRDVSLRVEPGSLLALVGPNGCGKSTLLSVLAGLRTPDHGTVHIDDRPIAKVSARELARLRSFVTQHNRTDTPFSVIEVIEMGRFPWLRTPQARRSPEIIDDAIRACDLHDITYRPFAQLSGGQQARVSIARALAQQTPVMLLDEPTAALDIHHQESVLDILRAARDDGSAILLVVHDLSLAAAYADRVALMKDGHLLADGPTREVMTAELLSDTYDHPVEIWDHPASGQPIIVPRRT